MYIAHVTHTCNTCTAIAAVTSSGLKRMSYAKRIFLPIRQRPLEVCLRPELHCLPAVCNNDDTAYRELHFTMPLTDPPLRGDAQTPCLVEWQIWFSENSILRCTVMYLPDEPNRRAVWTRFESVKVRVSSEVSRSFVLRVKSFSYALRAEIIFIRGKIDSLEG